MFKGKRILGIIPARGGSKRLPGKNIRPFLGKPLIARTIEAGMRSRYIDRLVVSTDDRKIAEVSRRYGADVPFMRPKRLATDKASSIDVILHAVSHLEKDGDEYEAVVLLQPTSPLRDSRDINNVIKMLFGKNADAVVSVCPFEYTPGWNVVVSGGDRLRVNGAVYAALTDTLKSKQSFYGTRTFAYKMPKSRSVDIDYIEDFNLAQAIAKCKKRR